MVYGNFANGLPPIRRPKLSKKSQDKEDGIKKNHMKLIDSGIVRNSEYIRTRLNGLTQDVKSKGINSFRFLQFFYINKLDIPNCPLC